jgi:tetratricopeptide (TPR) repeat protein
MGHKRERKGKRLLFHSACLLIILLLSTGCGTVLIPQKRQGNKHLYLAEELISKGDYDGALKEYEAAYLFTGDSPGDSALFHMGLTWAHPDNPKRDYQKALEYFERLVRDFPQSALTQDARVLAGTINELMLSESRNIAFEETLDALKNDLASLKETDIRVEEKNKGLEETVKALKKQLITLKENGLETEEKNKVLEGTVRDLKNQLNAFKEIDLGIEEKKR